MSATYRVDLTGGQLRVLHETLSVVLNDPYWMDALGSKPSDAPMLARASKKIMDAWRVAARTESTPAAT